MAQIRVLQISGVANTILLLAASPVLVRLTHSDEGGNTTASVISIVVLIAGHILAITRVSHVYDVVRQVAADYPVRCGLFVANLSLVGWLTINVLTRCGIIAVLFAGGVLLTLLSVCAIRRIAACLRLSPLSFATLYLLLCAGEVFLRYNPLLVGGGGGGNPALRQIYAGLYTENSHGMRGPEFSSTPAAGVLRIVMLGDSFTFGQGVAEGETYPDQVRTILSDRDPRRSYEVINAGRSGTDTYDQLQRLREQCLDFQPSLVTVQFYLNDLEPRLEATSDAGGFVDNIVMLPAHGSYAVFFLKFRFERLRDNIHQKMGVSDPGLEWVSRIADRMGPEHAEWLRFEEAVEGFAEINRERQLPIVFALVPHPGLEDLSTLRTVHQFVRMRIEEAGLPALDLIDVWSGVPRGRQVVSPIDHHPSASAHARLAEGLVRGLDELHLLDGPPN